VNLNLEFYKKYVSQECIWWLLIVLASFGILVEWMHGLSLLFHRSDQRVIPEHAIKRTLIDIEHHLKFKMFGDYALNLEPTEVENSQLNLSIVGIMYSTHPHLSQVIIQGENGFSKIYRQGDSLGFNLILKKIEPDGVILTRNGHLERLNLPKMELQFEAKPPPLHMNNEN
jgi:type II secretory pathway component PulC